jgi:hypothetical protein
MYDRMLSMGRFAERPVRAGGPAFPVPKHVQGGPVIRSERRRRAAASRAGAAKTLASGEPLP